MYTPRVSRPPVLTVSQLNFYIKSLIENDPRLGAVFLTGEISKLTVNQRSGHMYLTLKDARCAVSAVMFAGNVRRLAFRPEPGMKIICTGRVSVYEPGGQYQIIIDSMQPDGAGALALAFEQLKQRLAAQGLFDAEHKKALPKYPKTVGVVTSPTGAVIEDIRNVAFRRAPGIKLILAPAQVQGQAAAAQLVSALEALDRSGRCDVIIIGRGGGSAEDLWCFNDEGLARAVYACHTPVISAVGHETDFTICDMAADLRAPTPSAAAELAVPDWRALLFHFRSRLGYAHRLMDSLSRRSSNRVLSLQNRLTAASPSLRVARMSGRYRLCAQRLRRAAENNISIKESNMRKTAAKLESLNPLSVLSRGFAVARQDGRVIAAAAQLDREREFQLTFSDGTITAKTVGE